MKIAYAAKEAWEEASIKEKLPEHEVEVRVGSLQKHADWSDSSVQTLCVFVNSKVGVDEMNRFPALTLIATRSTGFDHIDLAEAENRGITVVNVPSYGVNTVAEFAFALILTLSRHVYDARKRVKEEGSFSQVGLTGFDLEGKTLGVVGCGRIGIHSVKIGRGFGMKVVAYDPKENHELPAQFGFTYSTLENLLREADVVTIHAPYMKETHHLINSSNISLMKKTAILVNTARGPIVETTALVCALDSDMIAGVGLDVLEHEEMMQDSAHTTTLDPEVIRNIANNRTLAQHPKAIVTPHIAFDTQEALERILNTTAQNIIAFTNGTPENVVAI